MDESRHKADGRLRVWRRVGERFADVNIVNQGAHGGGGVMRYCDEILRPVVVPFVHDHHLVLQHDNTGPRAARICTQFLEPENIRVLAWPAYSPDMSPIEHVWDALDRRLRCVPVPANIQQLLTAVGEEWTDIPQATINNLIKSMRRRCVALREANGGQTRY
ncbi:hypothetical protein SRHO_G00248150 [Serrasalmus rhombeus]